MNIFELASQYTIDDNFRKLLLLCAKNRPPPEFRISKGKIITLKGNTYDIPNEPIDVFNLVFNILNGIEIVPRNIPVTTSRRILDINDEVLYSFVKRKALEYNKGEQYIEKLISCVNTALYLGYITSENIIWNGDYIESIDGIDCKEIKITK